MKMISVIIAGILTLTLALTNCQDKNNIPITDLHIHLKGRLTIEDAAKKSEEEKIEYGIAVNCGLGFPVHNDSQIDSVLQIFIDYPQFYIGMQAEGREWVDIFSKETRVKFDYVFAREIIIKCKLTQDDFYLPVKTNRQRNNI